MKRPIRIFFQVTAIVFAAFVVLLSLAMVRLSQGPLPVNFLKSYLEKPFDPETTTLDVGDLVLQWGGVKQGFRVAISTFKLSSKHNAQILLSAEKISARLSFSSFLLGKMVPERLSLKNLYLNWPQIHQAPLALSTLVIKGRHTANDWSIQKIRAESGRMSFEMDGDLRWTPKQIRVNANLKIRNLSVDRLPDYWPKTRFSRTREWIDTHLSKGLISKADAKISLDIPKQGKAKIRTLDGTLTFQDLDIDYYAPLPKVTTVSGTAKFTQDQLIFVVDKGHLKDIAITGGTISIMGFQAQEHIKIDLMLSGPLQTMMDILDQEPLAYIRQAGLSPSQFQGHATTNLILKFPLTRGLKRKEIDISASASLKNVSVSNLFLKQNLSEAEANLDFGQSGLIIDGVGRFGMLSGTFEWQEFFDDTAPNRRKARFETLLNEKQRQNLGIKLAPYLTGPVQLKTFYTVSQEGDSELTIDADLTDSVLAFNALNYHKKHGVKGNAFFVVEMDNSDQPTIKSIPDFWIKSDDLNIEGRVEFLKGSRHEVAGIYLKQLLAGKTDIAGEIKRKPGQRAYDIFLEGDRFDFMPFLRHQKFSNKIFQKSGKKFLTMPLDITLKVSSLLAANNTNLNTVSAVLNYNGKEWNKLSLSGQFEEGILLLKRVPTETGEKFTLRSTNAGAALKALNITTHIRGGNIEILATSENGEAITGTLEANRLFLVDAPVFARILNGLSARGFLALLSSEGIQFERVTSDFSFENQLLKIIDAKASGSALGVTAHGTINTDTNELRLSGEIVPAYAFNQAIGSIPLLGQLLTGGKEGVIAATYHIKGRGEDAIVTVNPLSMLMPGFLRGLFFMPEKEKEEAQ